MLLFRVVKTKSGNRAVQVIKYWKGKRIIVKHIGSGNTEKEVLALSEIARSYILDNHHQVPLFADLEQQDTVLLLNQCEYQGFYYRFLYDILYSIQSAIGYTTSVDGMLNDLIVMRILEPASKLRSIELMETYFGIRHRRQRYYESALKWLDLKEVVEKQTLLFAQREYGFDFSLLFYDVTTLYFETFEADDLRKTGFSKDGKSQQPQILVALMVTQEGFPVAYEVFAGNTFEGHTILPVITAFINRHKVKNFTVVADAAMISATNIEALQKAHINYIVGARLGNISNDLFNDINTQLPKQDGWITRIKTDKGYLICSFSQQRYRKDKYEMDKQLEKAKMLLKQPSKARNARFLKIDKVTIKLNEDLIEKYTALL